MARRAAAPPVPADPIPSEEEEPEEEEFEEEVEVEEEEEETEYETEEEEDVDGDEAPATEVNAEKQSAAACTATTTSIPVNTSPPPATIDEIRSLLSPFGKDQLMELLTSAALQKPALLERLVDAADADPAHRKLFVFNLPPTATSESLNAAFSTFGPIGETRAVTERASGKCKGYGFVLFETRAAAARALSARKVLVNGREASVQIASLGASGNAAGPTPDATGRKMFVSGLPMSATAARLRSFFEKFGEIEDGPLGGDQNTGQLRGYAFFVYKTTEGLRKALEQPKKMFDGYEIMCQRALDGIKNKASMGHFTSLGHAAADAAVGAPAVQANDLALSYAPQSLLGLNPLVAQGLNPATLGLFAQNASANAHPTGGSGLLNPASYGVTPINHVNPPPAYGSGLGVNSFSPSVIGAYNSQATLQGVGLYQSSQGGKSRGAHLPNGSSLPDYYGR